MRENWFSAQYFPFIFKENVFQKVFYSKVSSFVVVFISDPSFKIACLSPLHFIDKDRNGI